MSDHDYKGPSVDHCEIGGEGHVWDTEPPVGRVWREVTDATKKFFKKRNIQETTEWNTGGTKK